MAGYGQVAESKVLQKAWRKALREGRVDMTFKTKAEATRIRFGLYNAVKAVKLGKEMDQELMTASQECIVMLRDSTVTVMRKSESDSFKTLLEAVGGVEEVMAEPTPMTTEDAEISASQARLLEKLKEMEPGEDQLVGRVTPYYTREKK